jgi:short-subunit dehydrogenase
VSDFAERYGPWAVVTGAAAGMGAAFAAELASRGVQVVGVDRDPVEHTARSLRVDLSLPDAARQIIDGVADVEVGLVVSNAALSYVGPFLQQGLDAALTQLHVNCAVPLTLVHHFLPRLVERGRGGVILLSSLSSMRGAPLVSGYAATKAWNLLLAESLWDEVRDQGVDVLAVLPGSTRTPGWLASQPQSSLGTSHVMEPAEVAVESLDAMGTHASIVPGQSNRDSEAFMASMGRTEAIKVMGEVMRTMYPAERDADPRV